MILPACKAVKQYRSRVKYPGYSGWKGPGYLRGGQYGGMQQFGSALSQTAMQMFGMVAERADATAVSEGGLRIIEGFSELEGRYAEDRDFRTMPERWGKDVEKMRGEILKKGIYSPDVERRLGEQFERQRVNSGDRLANIADAAEKDHGRAILAENVQRVVKSADDPFAEGLAIKLIEDAERAGHIDAEDAAARKIAVAKDIDVNLALMMAEYDPEAAIGVIDSSESLTAEEQKTARSSVRNAAAAARARAAEAEKVRHKEGFDEAFEMVVAGKFDRQTLMDFIEADRLDDVSAKYFLTRVEQIEAAEAAFAKGLAEKKDPHNREIYTEIHDARTAEDIEKIDAKITLYAGEERRLITIDDAKARRAELKARSEEIEETSKDWATASDLRSEVYLIGKGGRTKLSVQKRLKEQVIAGGLTREKYDTLYSLSEQKWEAYQGDAMAKAARHLKSQLLTREETVLEALRTAYLLATGKDRDAKKGELEEAENRYEIETWNLNRTERALDAWLAGHEDATAAEIDIEARRIAAVYDKDIQSLQSEYAEERAEFRGQGSSPAIHTGDIDAYTRADNPEAQTLPEPQSEEEYNQLPSGTRYRHPDGTIKVKP